ncbi:MAG: DUF4139 domain-containing protein [Planctomycetota bacterium]|jgi:hypothetical protein
MKAHLTEQELIEYQFKLASDVQGAEISGHLKDCTQCREHLEKLQRKFAALDLLHEEITASEDLISRVVEQAGLPRGGVRTRFIRFRKPAWLGAVAAVLLMGSILLVSNLSKDKIVSPEIVKESGSVESVGEMELGRKSERALTEDLYEKATIETKTYSPVAKHSEGITKFLSDIRTDGIVGGEISKRPPFAPASAIELVVLPRRDKIQLTIYNSADLTLVRERRNLTLKKGWNWLQFMWANTLIDPTSLSLEPLAQADKIDIQQLVFPARLRELGRWLIRSEVNGQVPFEITYFTSGLNWRAFYMGTLAEDEKTMELQGYVRVGNNSGEDYEKAQTRLIVGKVHILDQIAELAKRKYPYNSPIVGSGYGGGEWWAEMRAGDKPLVIDEYWSFNGAKAGIGVMRPKEIKKEGLSEYFLYSIEGTETIADKWGKRLLSFEAEDIKVKSLYKYDQERWGAQAIRFVSFTNDQEHNLGQTPIPNGTVKIYGQADVEGYLSYVGGTSVKYIPVDEEVELNLGPARLVKVEPTLMNYKTENYVYDGKKNITGWDEIRTWKIEVTNTRELPIELEITRGFGTTYWMLQADIAYEKHDATHARFKLMHKPRSKWTFGYTVTTYHGVREETLTKIKQ